MRTKVLLADNDEQAIRAVRRFQEEGHELNEIYVLAHDGEKTEGLRQITETNTIGVMEEGMATAFANLFRSRGDQLRAKMQSLGIAPLDAERYEEDLDLGRIMVLVWYEEDHGTLDRSDSREGSPQPPAEIPPEQGIIPPLGGVILSDRKHV